MVDSSKATLCFERIGLKAFLSRNKVEELFLNIKYLRVTFLLFSSPNKAKNFFLLFSEINFSKAFVFFYAHNNSEPHKISTRDSDPQFGGHFNALSQQVLPVT